MLEAQTLHGEGFLGDATRRFTRLVPCSQLVEAKGSRTQVGALVEATLVANDFAWVERAATPRRRLGGMAVEATASQVLSFF